LNNYIKVGIFDCPEKVKIGDTVEFVYNCYKVDDEEYNYRARGKVKYVKSAHVLVELPVGFKQVGNIRGWFGKSKIDLAPGILANRLYWWVTTFRLITAKCLEVE